MKILTNNCGLKLLSLVLAGIVSAYVVNEVNYPIPEVLHLPLQVRGLAGEMMLVNTVQPSIRVNVRGPFRLIRRLQGIAPQATLNLKDLTEPGNYTVPVQLPDLGQVTITSQQFSDYDVILDRRGQILRQLRIDQLGELSDYFQIGSEVLNPNAVQISGPVSLLETIAVAQVEPDLGKLDRRISDKLEPLMERLPVRLYDRDGHLLNQSLIKLEPEQVAYTLTPLPVGSIKVLKVLPEYVGEPAPGYLVDSLSPSVMYVKLDTAAVPEGVFSLSTSPIDVSKRNASFSARASIVYPFKLPPDSQAPQECDVQVEVVPLMAEPGALAVNVELRGRLPGLRYELDVATVDLIPQGESIDSEAIREKVQAFIDVSQLATGEYRLSPQLVLPLNVEGARILPPTVTLRISKQDQASNP